MNSFWAARNGREKFLIVLCLLAILIGGPMMLWPQGSGDSKLLPADSARHKYEDEVHKKRVLDDQTAKLQPAYAKLVYNSAPEELLPQVVRLLQDDARASGIHLREIKPLRAKKQTTIFKVPVSVRFTAPFDKSIPFLYRIEDPSGKLVVDKFNVTASDPKSRTVDVDVQVSMFTQASGPASGTPETGAEEPTG